MDQAACCYNVTTSETVYIVKFVSKSLNGHRPMLLLMLSPNDGISNIRIKNTLVPNFVVKVDHTLQPRQHKIPATWVEFGTSNLSSKFENRHYTKVCDLVQIGVLGRKWVHGVEITHHCTF